MTEFFDILSPLDKARLLRGRIEKLHWYAEIYANNRGSKPGYEANVIASLAAESLARCEDLLVSIENEYPLDD